MSNLLDNFDIGDFEPRRSQRSKKPINRFIEDDDDEEAYASDNHNDDQSNESEIASGDDSDSSSHSESNYGNIYNNGGSSDSSEEDEFEKSTKDKETEKMSSDEDYVESDKKSKKRRILSKGRSTSIKKAKRLKSNSATRRRSKYADSDDSDDMVYRTRRNVARKNYAEDSDPNEFVESDDQEARNSDEQEGSDSGAAPEVQIDYETIDKVLDHEPNIFDATTQSDVRYLIKWLGKSYIHNTWETAQSLQDKESLKGIKKWKNYVEQARKSSQWLERATLEEKEEYNISRERDRVTNESFKNVERIISQREDEDGILQYYVKWCGLPYCECTWEEVENISNFQHLIDDFLERDNRHVKCQKGANKRNLWTALDAQPKWIAERSSSPDLKLRSYQLAGVNWLMYSWSKNINVILGDEMGLGKTIQCITFLGSLSNFLQVDGPHLVVVPLSTLSAWKREFAKWTPFFNLIAYRGDANSRKICREHEFFTSGTQNPKFNVLLTTPEFVRTDKDSLGSIRFQTLIVDEAHRLKDHASAFYQSLVSFQAENIVLVTGTPIQNNLGELWSLLHILDPKQFHSSEDFLEQFKLLSEFKESDETNDADKKEIRKLHENIVDLLKPHLLRRTKKDVEKDLPNKNESILRVGLSPIQKKYYQLICQRNFHELNKTSSSKASLTNILMEMKKCCNHPFLLDYIDESHRQLTSVKSIIQNAGKMILLDKMLTKLKERGHRVLIFSQMVRMLDILSDYLTLKGWHHQRLDGNVKSEDRQRAMDRFNAPDSRDFCFLLSTRAGGLGINLATADTVIIYDADYNPQNDLQAEARAHRIGQKNIVNIYRFVTKSSVEEKILESAKRKMVLGHVVVEGVNKNKKERDNLAKLIQFGAQNLFENTDASQELSEADIISDIDLEEILDRKPVERSSEDDLYKDPEDSGVSDFLSAFKVANFARAATVTPAEVKEESDHELDSSFWEKIIPEDQRLSSAPQESLYYEPRRATLQVKSYKENRKDSQEDDSAESKDRKKKTKTKATNMDKTKVVKLVYKHLLTFGSISRVVSEALSNNIKGYTEKKLTTLAEDICSRSRNAASGSKFDYDGCEIDSQALNERMHEMKILSSKIKNYQDPSKYRVTFKINKPRKWPVDWTVTHDSMLLLGVYLHGVGNWSAIFDDEKLGFSKMVDKSGKKLVPTSMLKNRIGYLFQRLREEAKLNTKPLKSKGKSSTSEPTKANNEIKPSKSGKRKVSAEKSDSTPSPKRSKSDAAETFRVEKDIMDKCIKAIQGSNEDRVSLAKLARFFKDKNPKSDQKTFIKYMNRVMEIIHHHIGKLIHDEQDFEKYEFHFWTLVETLVMSNLGGERLYLISNRISSDQDFVDLL